MSRSSCRLAAPVGYDTGCQIRGLAVSKDDAMSNVDASRRSER